MRTQCCGVMEIGQCNDCPLTAPARPMHKPATSPAWSDAPTCEWKPDDSESGTWASGCGELWSFIDGGPTENRVRFCHGCGRPVVVKEQSA